MKYKLRRRDSSITYDYDNMDETAKKDHKDLGSYMKSELQHHVKSLEKHVQTVLEEKNNVIIELKVQNFDLEAKVQELEKEVEDFKAEKEDFKEIMAEKMEHFKKMYDEKFQSLQSDRESLISNLKSKIEKDDEITIIDSPTQQNKKQDKILRRLKLKLKKRKEKLSATSKRKKELVDLNNEKDKIINIKNKNIDDLCLIIKRCEKKVKDLEFENDDLKETAKENTNNLNDDYDKKVKDLESKNETLKERLEDIELDLIKVDTLKLDIAAKNKDLVDMASKNKDLLKINDDLKEQIKFAKNEIEKCNKWNESQEKVVLEQNEKINTLKEKLDNLSEKLKFQTIELEKLEQNQREAEYIKNRTVIEPDGLKLLNILDDECRKLKEATELDELRKKIDDQREVIVKLKESVQNYQNQEKDTEEKLEKLVFITNQNEELKEDLRVQVENNISIQTELNKLKSKETVIDVGGNLPTCTTIRKGTNISSESVIDLIEDKLLNDVPSEPAKKRGRPSAKEKIILSSSLTLLSLDKKSKPPGPPIVEDSTFQLLNNLQNGSIDLDIVID